MNRSPTSFFKSLNIKIILYFIAFAFIPLLIFSILGYYLNKDMISRLSLSQLKTINSSYAKEVDRYLNYRKSHLGFIVDKYKNLDELDIFFSKIGTPMRSNAHFVAFELIHQSGKKTIYAKSDYTAYPFIDLLYNSDTTIRAYINPMEIQDLLRSDISEYNHYVYLPEYKKKISSRGFESFTDQDSVLTRFQSTNPDLVTNAVIEQESSGMFTAFTLVDNGLIIVASQLNARDVFTELTAFRNKILVANLVIATILFLLALFYSRQITTPIHKLIKAIQRIRQGNLEHEIRLETNDEIRILAHEFELMRQKLQDSYQGMEEKIKLRTRELKEAQAQISHQEKMASLGLMAAGIAHEIGNPLTSISSMAQVIKRKNPNDKTVEYVQNILKNIERISRIVRELVDFSRPTSQKRTHADINEIIKSAVGIIKYDRRSKKIQFIMNLDQALPHTILVTDHLLQVFLNILINALDASEGYGDEIEVKSYRSNEHIHIEISDQGCGIAHDKLNKIFEPFYTTKEVGKGTGLGLTVSYGIIKKMDGEIKVESTLEKGSTFSIILPIKDETEVMS